jgi:hypothetical protein
MQRHFTAQPGVPNKYELLQSALSQRLPAIESAATSAPGANTAFSFMVAS